MTKTTLKLGLLFLLLTFSGCINPFRENFIGDQLVRHYKPNVIAYSENPKVFYTKNLEVDAIGMIENGFVPLGYAYFQYSQFDSKFQVESFASEIGASAVLLKDEYLRTKKMYENVSTTYPVSTVPYVVNSPAPLPEIRRNYQVQFQNGKLVQETISTSVATELWNVPVQDRGFYAVPYGQHSVIIPTVQVPINTVQERNVDIYSYYASFWVRTNYPPALGVEVSDVRSEKKKQLDIINGVSVWGVLRGSPASSVGIYRGDHLLSINDEPIISRLQMGSLIRKNVGKTIKIEILRNGEKEYKNVTLNKLSF